MAQRRRPVPGSRHFVSLAPAFAGAGVLLLAAGFAARHAPVAHGFPWRAFALGATTVLGVWALATWAALRGVPALLASLVRLRAGDFTARTGIAPAGRPLGRLAGEVDALAGALQERSTEQQRTEALLRLSEARKSAVLEASLDGILVLDGSGRVQECNAAARKMFGCDGRRCVHHQLLDLFPRGEALARPRLGQPSEVFETPGRRLDASEFPAEVSIAPIRDPAVRGLFVATVRDVSERRQWERSLEVLSFVDDLTGLYNRRGFLMLAERQLKLAARAGQRVVLVLVDLDGLKRINDTFGHANGDAALVELATAMRRSFRETDVIGRLGGDEFAVLATESEQEGAELATQRLAMRLASRNGEGDLPWTLSASIGWLREPASEASDLREMLARVDERMYAQKLAHGPGRVGRGPSLEPDVRPARAALPRLTPARPAVPARSNSVLAPRADVRPAA